MSAVATLNLSDEEVIKSFPCYEGPGVSGYIIDFLGIKTRTSYICQLPKEGGVVEGYPIPVSFHATAVEWAGVLRAVLEADSQMVAVELGAGWAPWLVTAARAAALIGIPRVSLIGVEGCKEHCEYMTTHFLDNGLNPDHHTLIHGVVGTTDGIAEFPLLPDPSADYGARAIFADKAQAGVGYAKRSRLLLRRLGRKGVRVVRAGIRSLRDNWKGIRANGSNGSKQPALNERTILRVQRFSLSTLLRSFTIVDLVHVDIQGDEYDVIASAPQILKKKVKRLVIGTHSRAIEQNLLDQLAGHGWVLESEESCKFLQQGDKMLLTRDGCQVWRNPILDTRPDVMR
jgi:FkbM family methyltransferase